VVIQVPDQGLTAVERALVDHVGRGEWLDLASGDEAPDEASMRSWGESRTCRASVIRDILRGRLGADPDPHGLRLRGARISGRLDLENLATGVNLELSDCLLEDGILARDARMARITLNGCQIEHPAEPPLDVERLTCSVLSLEGARIVARSDAGAINLVGARIGGNLNCAGAKLRNGSGTALLADQLQVGQDMYLRDEFTATGGGYVAVKGGVAAASAVSLNGAQIGGNLMCYQAELRSSSGAALAAMRLQVGQDMLLGPGFTATGTGFGAVYLSGARIGGRLDCSGAKLSNDSGAALAASGLQVGQDMHLHFTATGRGFSAVYLSGAHIGGRLDCNGAKLRNGSGAALFADVLQVDQDMLLGGFNATGSGGDGTARLVGARIAGQFSCAGAELHNRSGPALAAMRLQVGQDMFLTGRFTGSGEDGAVNLVGAQIGGQFSCAGRELRNGSGPALAAMRLQVGHDMLLTGGYTGSGDAAAVNLVGAQMGGQFSCAGAELLNGTGPALAASGLQVAHDMLLTGGFTGNGDAAAVNLTEVRVGGTFSFDPVGLAHAADPHRQIAVDGLTYAGVPVPVSVRDWLRLLREGTPRYAAQPYQQLAAGYQALGHEREAREVLMAQRDDQLARTNPGWLTRLWGRVTKVTLGYGYQPWRALLFLAGVVAVSCVLAVVLGSHGALAPPGNTASRSCTVLQEVSVGLDLNLPVGTSLARAGCGLSGDPASVAAAWLAATGWVLRLSAWAFAALFIAGFTSAVRKT
jgi:hypothetical protein